MRHLDWRARPVHRRGGVRLHQVPRGWRAQGQGGRRRAARARSGRLRSRGRLQRGRAVQPLCQHEHHVLGRGGGSRQVPQDVGRHS
eukprot:1845414-Prymnesium_polylepis.1